jgi:hypothetical protein
MCKLRDSSRQLRIQPANAVRLDREITGQSDWLSWSSAIGARTLKAAERNYVLDYFSKSSPMNYLIASGVKKIDPNSAA